MSCELPLVVDLDQTLVRTDTLLEQIMIVAFKAPLQLPWVVTGLLQGRAIFKRRLCEAAQLSVEQLPYDEEVIAFLREQRALGRGTHLVTAADQAIANQVAEHLHLFDTVQGSDSGLKLQKQNKAEAVRERFAGGYGYIGDSSADLHVWRMADEVLIAGNGARLRRQLAREGRSVHRSFTRPAADFATWRKALRVHHWSKNLLLFAPLLLAQLYDEPWLIIEGVLGFLLLSAVASATYILNDLSDLAADRAHPTKRERPLAAGRLPLRLAAPVALLLLAGGVIGGFLLQASFGGALFAYTALTLLYSFKLKMDPLTDVLTIGALFTLRVIAGMLLFETPISIWLSTFTFMLFTCLALAKRTAELVRAEADGRSIVGRGYVPGDALLTMSLAVAIGITAVLLMVLYMALEASRTGLYQSTEPLFLIPVVLMAWILRILLRAHRGSLQDDPVVFALRDRVSWVHGCAVACLWFLAVMPISPW